MIEPHHVGLGLRPAYYSDLLSGDAPIDWLELVTDDFLSVGGVELLAVERIRSHYPVVLHGVGLSLGSMDPLSLEYLKALKVLVNRLEPEWVSDHLCWTGIDGWCSHDLLPLPRTQETLDHLVSRIHAAQEYLQRTLVLENVTSYIAYKDNTFSEWEFMRALAKATGCSFLLDINNSYVNANNHRQSLVDMFEQCPWEHVRYYHIAGHELSKKGLLLDTHRSTLSESVLELMAQSWQKKPAPILLERDDCLPTLSVLLQEMDALKKRIACEFA